jgi:hypothetical protein
MRSNHTLLRVVITETFNKVLAKQQIKQRTLPEIMRESRQHLHLAVTSSTPCMVKANTFKEFNLSMDKDARKLALGSSSMVDTRSERRSKQSRGSGGCCGAELTMEFNCATKTPNLDKGVPASTILSDFLVIPSSLSERSEPRYHYQPSPTCYTFTDNMIQRSFNLDQVQ